MSDPLERAMNRRYAEERRQHWQGEAEREHARAEALSARIADLRARVERAEERIREIAVLFGVPDGGRYLNDWKARAERVASLRQALASLRAAVCGIRVSAYPAHGSGFVAVLEGGLDEARALLPPQTPGEEG